MCRAPTTMSRRFRSPTIWLIVGTQSLLRRSIKMSNIAGHRRRRSANAASKGPVFPCFHAFTIEDSVETPRSPLTKYSSMEACSAMGDDFNALVCASTASRRARCFAAWAARSIPKNPVYASLEHITLPCRLVNVENLSRGAGFEPGKIVLGKSKPQPV